MTLWQHVSSRRIYTQDVVWIQNTHTTRGLNTEHTQHVSWIQNTHNTCLKYRTQQNNNYFGYITHTQHVSWIHHTDNLYLEYTTQWCVVTRAETHHNLYVSFAKEPYKRDHILPKRPSTCGDTDMWLNMITRVKAHRSLSSHSFICETWLVHMWDMTHSYVRHVAKYDNKCQDTWHYCVTGCRCRIWGSYGQLDRLNYRSLLQNIISFCRISSPLLGSFAKETYNL